MNQTPRGRRRFSRARPIALALAGAAAALTAAAPASAYDASVTRTTGGIAHIKASTLGNGGFGVGYAAAQDNLCTLADVYLTTSGERARYLGAGSGNANVSSDFFWKSIIDDRSVEKQLDRPFPEGPSKDARELAAGYAAGYNDYLAKSGGRAGISDPRCKGAEWVRPISEIDVWRLANSLGMRASSGQYIAAMAAAAPPAAAPPRVAARAGTTDQPLTADEIAANLKGSFLDPTSEQKLGSNAIGLGRDATQKGDGLVLGNPHFPWAGNERFWEFHLQVAGDVDVIGASLMGSPVVNIGHNRHVAWSHTVSTGRRFTLHKLQLAPGNPTSYVYAGETVPMRKQTVTVQVKGGDGSLSPQSHDWYFSRFGRLTTFPQLGLTGAAAWSTSTAYAFGDANGDNLRLFDQWLAMNRAGSAQDIIDAQAKIQGIPWVNTLGADDRGNAFYTDLSVTPHLTQAQIDGSCVPAGLGQAAKANRVYLLDGSRPECSLGSDEDAVKAGIFGAENLPHTKRADYVQNSNDSHWLTNPTAKLEGFSQVIGLEGTEQGLRTRLGLDIIGKRLAGTDGLSATPKFTLGTLKQSWTANRNLGAELMLPGLRQLCHDNPSITITDGPTVDVTAACTVLDAYDGSGNRDSAGGWLFSRWYATAPIGGAGFWATPYSPANPLTTPNTVNPTLAGSKQALAKAVVDLQTRNIPLNATWGDVQKATRGSEKIAIPGCNTGCYPVTSVSTAAGNYGEVQSGSSFVMFAEVDPDTGPRAQALLSYSQSEDSTSPYYADQTRRFSNSDFITLPYRENEIAADQLSTIAVADGTTQGPVGPEGPRGPEGPAGPGGADGSNGTDGVDGAPGANGAAGPLGPVGPVGPTGPGGATGVKGDTGQKGDKGDRGPRGFRTEIRSVRRTKAGTRVVSLRVTAGARVSKGRTVTLRVGTKRYRKKTSRQGIARFVVPAKGKIKLVSVR
jgi:acyl-homoserine-lactone acylase